MRKQRETKVDPTGEAWAYRRTSTAEQELGLDAQLDACRDYAARSGLAIRGHSTDQGIHGDAPIDRRPGLMEALQSIRPGDVLLVAKRDRLGRDKLVVAMIDRDFAKIGARIISAAGEGTEGDSPTDQLLTSMIDAIAVYERCVIRARTRAALAELRKRGRNTGHLRIDQAVTDDGISSKTGARAKLHRPSLVVPAIEGIRARALMVLYHARGESPRKIARSLASVGVLSAKTGGPYPHQTIREVLFREAASVGTLIEDAARGVPIDPVYLVSPAPPEAFGMGGFARIHPADAAIFLETFNRIAAPGEEGAARG